MTEGFEGRKSLPLQRLSQFMFCVLAIVCAMCSFAGAQAATVQRLISGFVRAGDAAAAGVSVELTIGEGEGHRDTTLTDSRGRFSFINLVPALYYVTAHLQGYQDATQPVDIRYAPTGMAYLELKPKPSTAPPAVPPGGPGAMLSANVPSTDAARKALEKGQKLLLEKNDAEGSIKQFRKVLETDPNYAPAYVLMGTAYASTRNWGKAQTAFQSAIKADKGNASAWVGLGAALNQQRNYAEAEKSLRHAVELNAGTAEGQYELGRALFAQGKWQEAEPPVRQALTLNKEYLQAHVLLGNILLRKQDGAGALQEFKQCLQLQPEGPIADQVRPVVAKLEEALKPKN